MKTDAAGRYRFAVRDPDTTSQYAVGLRHAGVGYVSRAVGRGAIVSTNLGSLTVFDTSSTVAIEVSQRHLLVQPPSADGSVPVLELIVLRNSSSRTRIPADSTQPTWKTHILAEGQDLELGDSDFEHGAVQHGEGDSIAVVGPITPGEKQIVLTYVLPRRVRELRLPVDHAADTLGIMVSDTLAHSVAGPLEALGVTSFENIPYLRLEAKDVKPGDAIVVALSPPPMEAVDFWWVVLLLTGGAMAATWFSWVKQDRLRAGLTDEEIAALQAVAREAPLAPPTRSQ